MNELCALCEKIAVSAPKKLEWAGREMKVFTCQNHFEIANWMLADTIAGYASDPIKKVLFKNYFLGH